MEGLKLRRLQGKIGGVDNLQEELDSARELAESYRQQAQLVQQDRVRLAQTLTLAQRELEQARCQIAQLQTTSVAAESQFILPVAQEVHIESVDDIVFSSNSCPEESPRQNLVTALSEAHTRISNLSEENETLCLRSARAEGRSRELETELTELRTQVSQLQQQLRESQSERVRLETQCREQQATLASQSALKEQVATLERERNALTERATEATLRAEQASNDLAAMHVEELPQLRDFFTSSAALLTTDVERIHQTMEQRVSALAVMIRRQGDAVRGVAALVQQFRDALRDSVNSSQLEAAESRALQAERRLQVVSSQFESLQNDLAISRCEAATLREHVDQWTDRLIQRTARGSMLMQRPPSDPSERISSLERAVGILAEECRIKKLNIPRGHSGSDEVLGLRWSLERQFQRYEELEKENAGLQARIETLEKQDEILRRDKLQLMGALYQVLDDADRSNPDAINIFS